MGSPITFSGFNQIDFNVVLNAIMQQESQPLQALQDRQTSLQSEISAFASLATRLGTLHTAASALSDSASLTQYAATSSDNTAVSVSSTGGAVSGRYDVVVQELARTQVTASLSTVADADTTIVATGGTLTIGGATVTVSEALTLNGLKNLINQTSSAPATASIVETSPGAFRLVLSGKSAGAANAFTLTNALTGGAGIAFTDTDNDNISGDSAADNAVSATNASALINNIQVTSTSNTLTTGIPGVSLTLLQKDLSKTITVTVDRDDDSLISRVDDFATAYNSLVKFANDQATAAGQGKTGTIGRESILRSLRDSLRGALSAAYGSGSVTRLAEVGIGFDRTGQLVVDKDQLRSAIQTSNDDVTGLFSDDGAFGSIDSLITEYTQSAGGFLPDASARLTSEISRLDGRIVDLQARLALRRTTLRQEFTAADALISQLNSQSSSLASLSSSLIGNPIK